MCVADPPPLSLVRKEIKKFINKGEETTYVTMEGILIIINSERERDRGSDDRVKLLRFVSI